MTATIEYLLPKVRVAQYDGTNWSDLIAELTVDPSYQLTLVSEVDGVATFTVYDAGTDSTQPFALSAGDYVYAGDTTYWPTVVSSSGLSAHVKLSDLL